MVSLYLYDCEQTEEQLLGIEKSKVHVRGDTAEYWMYEKLRDFFLGPGKHETKMFLCSIDGRVTGSTKAVRKLME